MMTFFKRIERFWKLVSSLLFLSEFYLLVKIQQSWATVHSSNYRCCLTYSVVDFQGNSSGAGPCPLRGFIFLLKDEGGSRRDSMAVGGLAPPIDCSLITHWLSFSCFLPSSSRSHYCLINFCIGITLLLLVILSTIILIIHVGHIVSQGCYQHHVPRLICSLKSWIEACKHHHWFWIRKYLLSSSSYSFLKKWRRSRLVRQWVCGWCVSRGGGSAPVTHVRLCTRYTSTSCVSLDLLVMSQGVIYEHAQVILYALIVQYVFY